MSNTVKSKQKVSKEVKYKRVVMALETILKNLRGEYTLAKEKGHPLDVIVSLGKSVRENLDWLEEHEIEVDPDKFSSVSSGGNGLCYTCKINPARINSFNCFKCAGVPSERKSNLSVSEMRRRTLKMRGRKTIKESSVKKAEEVFGAKAN